MTDQFKNMLIGIFVLAACAIVIFILLFLHPSTGNEGKYFVVRFSDIDKVNLGTRVTFAGRPVGEVVEIKEIEFGRTGHHDANDRIYVYELKLVVDSAIDIYNTDQISLRTSGLLGERSVAITPLAPRGDQKLIKLNDQDIIYAQESSSVEDAMAAFRKVSTRAETALIQISDIMEDIKKAEIVKKVSASLDNIEDITTALNQPEELTAIVTNLQDFSNELATRIPPSWDKLDASLDQLNKASINIHDATDTAKNVVVDISKGKGTAGQILVSDDLYLRFISLLNKGDTIMNDINHYGLLFQTDKGWQRMRARQRNLLTKLSNPQEFRNFFNDEVDRVSTSLARVSMILDQTQLNCPGFPMAYNPDFAKVYAELLRRVQALEGSLKMYDMQLCEPKVSETEFTTECK